MTLVEFLTARWEEQRQRAEKDLWCLDRATPTPWRAHYGHNLPESYLATDGETPERVATFSATDGGRPADGYEDRHSRDVMLAARMATSARARAQHVLADVAAKRAILAAYPKDLDGCDERVSFDGWESCSDSCPAEVMTRVLQLLALPYAGHPDYDEGWAP